ncbi:MAG: transcriptional regulator of sugar metabolism [Microbacterium sp.]|jgi:hypothetical protein|nr:transcriptional regulator of sugar metabolism [Microbacterium sp.]
MRGAIARLSLALFMIVALALPTAAHAASAPRVTVSPAEIVVGETATVTVSGLLGVDSVRFALEPAEGGSFSPGDSPEAEVAVTDGEARVEVTAARVGDLLVSADAGESTRIEATVVVVATPGAVATSTSPPTASNDSAQAEPDAEAENGRLVFVLVPLIAAVVIGIGAVLVISKSRRGRRGD